MSEIGTDLSSRTSLAVLAPAKINLFLAVKGRRADGYHQLETWMQKIDLADTLYFEEKESGIDLVCPGSVLPTDMSNIVYRATVAFFKHTGIDKGVKIVLEKKIPVAAGLGGGSSDAAATLNGLQKLFSTKLGEEEIRPLAVSLGADVPFFTSSFQAVWATGIGDILQQVPSLKDFWILLVNPGFEVSTRWVYENFALTTIGNPYILGREQIYGNLQEYFLPQGKSLLFNDLESVTMSRYPELGVIKAKMVAEGARVALMSGSGPTVFGLYENKDDVMRNFRQFQQQYGNVFIATPYSE